MSALSADHRRIFAGFDAKVAARRSDDGFISIGTSALDTRQSASLVDLATFIIPMFSSSYHAHKSEFSREMEGQTGDLLCQPCICTSFTGMSCIHIFVCYIT